MRTLILLACSLVVVAALAVVPAGAQSSTAGDLSIAEGRGVVVLEIRGVVLGRLGRGTLRVTDLSPRDPFGEIVTGKSLEAEERVGPRTVLYRGQGLRFRMVGGGYRIRIAGSGITVAARGRGAVMLDGESRLPTEAAGLYSLSDGVDCSVEPTLCSPLPDEPERHPLGAPSEEGDG
jgi:hypothetical protein